jgi:hypothetical protein
MTNPRQVNAHHARFLRFHGQQERVARRLVLARFGLMYEHLQITLDTFGIAGLAAMMELIITPHDHLRMLKMIYITIGTAAAQNEYDRLLPGAKAQSALMLTKDKDPTPLPNPVPNRGNITLNLLAEQWRAKMRLLAQSHETAERVTKITDKTRQLIRDTLSEGAASGWDIRTIGRALRKAVVDPVRALLIARTETTRASSAGHEAGAESTNLVLNKVWIATADSRTRPDHLAMLSSKPVPKDGLFIVGGLPMKYPGDPAGGAANCSNCRCTVSYLPAVDYFNLN